MSSTIRMYEDTIQSFMAEDEDTQLEVLTAYSDYLLKKISKITNRARMEKNPNHNSEPKYGNLRQVFYEDELRHFFETIRNPAVAVWFQAQFFYGLRISEVQKLRLVDRHTVRIPPSKGKNQRYMPVHGRTFKLLLDLREVQSYSAKYMAKCFRAIRKDAELDMTYGTSKSGNKLYQFTSHNLRKTAATLFSKAVDGSYHKVQHFLRHSKNRSYEQARKYVWYDSREFKDDLETTFEPFYDLI